MQRILTCGVLVTPWLGPAAGSRNHLIGHCIAAGVFSRDDYVLQGISASPSSYVDDNLEELLSCPLLHYNAADKGRCFC